jgi:tripartite-type tricarboxylate transporter receptor subunit TctC
MPSFAFRRPRTSVVVASLALGLAAAEAVQAQNAPAAAAWPDRPVRIVVPFPPGGAADTFARLVGQKLGEVWGNRQPLVIENRSGAGGIIGSEVVARAPADGATLLMVTIGHAVNPYMFSKLPYDTANDFAPVATVANVPSLVVTGPAFKGTTLAELIAEAKAKPGKIEFASSGTGSTSHVGAALMESMAGIDMVHVPYKGAAPALQDVVAGRVTMSVDIITSSMQLAKTQKLRALAITSAKRSPQLPEVPTVAEAGIPGYAFSAWYMLLAPGKTPPALVERMNADVRKAVAMPDFRTKIEDIGGEVASASVAETDAMLKGEFARWQKVVRERNIRAD